MLQPFRVGILFLWLFIGCREVPKSPAHGGRATAEIRLDTGENFVLGEGMKRQVQPLTGIPRTVRVGRPQTVTLGSNESFLEARIKIADLDLSKPGERACRDGSDRLGERLLPMPVIGPAGLPEQVEVGGLTNREGSSGKFSLLNARQGLPTSVIRDILVGHDGALWISTTGGVCQFDGRILSTYTRQQGLVGNDVTALHQDREGNIWFGTYEGALIRFDGRTFAQYPGKENIINCLAEDSDGNIWGGTKEAGVFRFRQGEFTYFGKEQGWPDLVFDIKIDRYGNRWLASSSGLFIDNGECLREVEIEGRCSAIAVDSNRQVWFAVEGQLYSADGQAIYAYKRDPADRRSSIQELVFDPGGNLWMSTGKNGIQVFNGRSFTRYDESDGLPGDGAMNLTIDTDGGLWAHDMENVIRFNGSGFTAFSGTNALPVPGINTLFKDSRGRIWMSSIDVIGLYCMDGNTLEYYGVEQGLPEHACIAITEDHQGVLWLAFWDVGLCRFDGHTITTYTRANGLYWDRIYSLVVDTAGNVWCSSDPAVMKFEPDVSRFVTYYMDVSFCSRALTRGRSGEIWAGSCDGLFRFDAGSDSSFRLYRQVGRSIEALLVDRGGQIWTGPYEDGLYYFDGKKSIHFPGERLGIQNTLGALTEDQDGNLWIGSFASGLLKLDRGKFNTWYAGMDTMPMDTGMSVPVDYEEMINRFRLEDGFLPNTVHQRSVARSEDGYLWFGTSDGVTRVDPGAFHGSDLPPPVGISAVRLFNLEMDWSASGLIEQKLANHNVVARRIRYDSITPYTSLPVDPSFPHTVGNITFQFGGVYLHNPGKLRYQFRLEGLDKTWSDASAQSEVNYGNLAPGPYSFQVRGRNAEGPWSEITSFPFTVRPPWWNTWWARLIYLVVVGGVFYALRRFELNRQQLKFRLRLEQMEAERLKEVDTVKNRLYTNITHEFRTPLTVILGMADQMESKPRDPVQDRVRLIRRNGQQLLSLVNQMLDLAKIESHQMTLHLIQGDLAGFLGYVTESFRSLADQKDIRILVQRPEVGVVMDFDEGKMLQVLSNLLSNAIKFTPPGGEVRVAIWQEREDLYIEVRDTGMGIHPDQLPLIFNKFYQADNSHTRQGEGTGIGLTLTRELVSLMDGVIEVKSQWGQGSVFTVRLPIRHSAEVRPIAWGPVEERMAGNVAEETVPPGESAPALDLLEERPQVLVVEDNPDVMTYLVSCLGDTYEVIQATDGIMGIEKALEIVPDLVITDVMMPGKDGFEVCDTLKQDIRTSHVPVIILTARASVEDRIAGLARGADAYLAKPFHPDELKIHLGNLIAMRQRLQERYRHLESPLAAPATADEKVEDAFLVRLRELVEAEWDNAELSIEDICKRLAMSRMQLHRKIKALTDRSTSIYIRSIRLQHGRRLLETGKFNVSETAYAVGFDDPSYFSRVFQEEFGILPSELKAGQA